MRLAVRDYKYEVSEGRMTEECNQYLQQLQKDWERHRVKIGVEQLRKEVPRPVFFLLNAHLYSVRSANVTATVKVVSAHRPPSTKCPSTRTKHP